MFAFPHTLMAMDWVGYSQGIIINKMVEFLESEPDPDAGQRDVITKLSESNGECAGLSSFWLLSKRISDEQNPHNEPRDDNEFFNYAVSLLTEKVPEVQSHPLSDEERSVIKRFIGHVLYFQNAAHDFTNGNTYNYEKYWSNVDMAKAYEYLTGKKIIELLELNPFICNQEILTDRMLKIIRPGVLIAIASEPVSGNNGAGHATALYQSGDGTITFYDPNYGEKSYRIERDGKSKEEYQHEYQELITELAGEIFKSTNLEVGHRRAYLTESSLFRKLNIHVYHFEKDGGHKPYSDLHLKFSEKQSMTEKYKAIIRHFFKDDTEEFKDRITNSFKSSVDAAPLYSEDLMTQLEVQGRSDRNLLDTFWNNILLFITKNYRPQEKYQIFTKYIEEKDHYPIIRMYLNEVRSKKIGPNRFWNTELLLQGSKFNRDQMHEIKEEIEAIESAMRADGLL